MKTRTINQAIEQASQRVGLTWPLYSFVTSNPLSGYEHLSFYEGTKMAMDVLGANIYPDNSAFKNALESGEIDRSELGELLNEHGWNRPLEHYLNLMDCKASGGTNTFNQKLDRLLIKYLSFFMDEGLAEWEMPNKALGFYHAWRKMVSYDKEYGKTRIEEIPSSAEEALNLTLQDYEAEAYSEIFTYQLASLPGWTGYIKHRSQNNTAWQRMFPINLKEYLAVRLWTAHKLNLNLLPNTAQNKTDDSINKLKYLWLKAWEKSTQKRFIKTLKSSIQRDSAQNLNKEKPQAQFVFCIDTRSELIRRHVESVGPYETYGYAGFFGLAMDYENPKDGLLYKSCPPIVDSNMIVSEFTKSENEDLKLEWNNKIRFQNFWTYFLKRMKNMLPSSFGYVEGSGVLYGLSLITRTLIPGSLYAINRSVEKSHENFCEPTIKNNESLVEQAQIVKSAFDLMGWKEFAPLVVFAGHGSHSANNHYGSSLDCGACAANPGRHNARMLANLANDKEIRALLKTEYDINIPENTYFIGAEHNTTTDEIILFGADLPISLQPILGQLKKDLKKAQNTASMERLGITANAFSKTKKMANNWAETRPEWGLAKNNSFIIGPRLLTKNNNLQGQAFLHSYDWKMDVNGKALSAIMQGPMVVTQWINNHYYFSSVDNEKFGGGKKTVHNVTGKFGAVNGNGGDLKMGLPWESLYQNDGDLYHKPLRLSVYIEAPLNMIEFILMDNKNLKTLVENEWIYLLAIDPLSKSEVFQYTANNGWEKLLNKAVKKSDTEYAEEDLLVEEHA